MTTKTTQPKPEGVLALLGAIIKNSVDLPDDVSLLATGLKTLAEEVKQITKTLTAIASALHSHSIAINELFTVQEIVLKQLKLDLNDTKLPDLSKDKSQKPN